MASGIEDAGGAFNVDVDDCAFHGSTNAIKTLSTGVAQPLMWTIRKSRFRDNTNHLVVDATQWEIIDNVFGKFTTQSIKLDQVGNAGGYNIISRNSLSGTYSIAGGYKSNAATDEWGGLKIDASQMTSVPGVFAGGDSTRGPSLVVHAVRDGRKDSRGRFVWPV